MRELLILTVLSFSGYSQTTANLWVATSAGSCTRSAAAVSYNAATACGSFAAAWSAANGGDVILVQPGSYPAQNIGKPDKAGTAMTTFGAANGIGVTVASLNVTANYVEVDNIATAYDSTSRNPGNVNIGDGAQSDTTYTNHVTIKNGTSQTLFVIGQYITIQGGSYGNYDPCQNSSAQEDTVDVWCNNACSMESKFITFDGVTVHDQTDHGNTCSGLPGNGRHVDGIQFLGGTNVIIRNSKFYNNATSNVLARPYMGAAMGSFTVENNQMGDVLSPGNGVLLGATGDTVSGSNVVRYNTLEMDLTETGNGTFDIYGNILNNYGGCVNGSYEYNVFDGPGTGCGTNVKHGSVAFVNNPTPTFQGAAPNFDLANNATLAHGAGDPSRYPATDIHGTTRTSPPDAGAAQYYTPVQGPPPQPPTAPQPPTVLRTMVE